MREIARIVADYVTNDEYARCDSNFLDHYDTEAADDVAWPIQQLLDDAIQDRLSPTSVRSRCGSHTS